MTRSNRDYWDRLDDGILVQVHGLSRHRSQTLHASLEDFRQTVIENAEALRGSEDYDLWLRRVERCNMMLSNPDDRWLRNRTAEALEQDR